MTLRLRFWAGIALAVAGVAIGGVLFVRVFLQINDDVESLHRFGATADGGALEIVEAQLVTVFLEPQERSLDGVRYAVLDVSTGAEIPVRAAGSRFTYDFPAGSGRSIGTVALVPGEYVVEVVPADVTIAIGPSPAPSFGDFFRAIVWGGVLIVVGAAMAIVAAVQQTRARTQEASVASSPTQSPWATGTWDDPSAEHQR